MTTEPARLETLLETCEGLFREVPAEIDSNEREFLGSLMEVRPNWSLLDIRHRQELSAILWRLQNLQEPERISRAPFCGEVDALDGGVETG